MHQYLFLNDFKFSLMKTFKDLFKSSLKQPLDFKTSIDDQSSEASSSNWSSDSEQSSKSSDLRKLIWIKGLCPRFVTP